MSKKTFIIIAASILLVILLALVAYFILIQNNKGPNTGPLSVFKNFFPFGGSNPQPSGGGEQQQEPPTPSKQTGYDVKLRKISSEPVAGAGTIDVKVGSVIRYIERATGHIYEVELFSPKQGRISNTTIPLAYDAVWGNKNNSLVARYLKDDNQTIDSYSITVKDSATSTENAITAVHFPDSLSDVVALDSNVFYLQQKSNYSIGIISSFDGKKTKQIWNSPIRELNSQFVNAKTVALNTKPAQGTAGFLYFVDTSTGGVKKILGNILELSSLISPDAAQIVYSSDGNPLNLSFFDVKTKSLKKLSPSTFPEKCVWSSRDKNIIYCGVPQQTLNGESLTLWYKGLLSFNDSIWKYDLKNNTSSVIENLLSDSGEVIDVIKPILSTNERYLIFINKNDNSLWSLDLTK